MGQELSRAVSLRRLLLIATTFLICSCSPKLDWRSVQSPQEGYTALFPGKPDKLERRIPYQEQELLQILEAVKIDDDIYSVSSIYLSKQETAFLATLLQQLKQNLFRISGVDELTVINSDGMYQLANHQRIPTKDYFLEFKSTNTTQQSMRVRWITKPAVTGGIWLYQVSVLHAGSVQPDVKTFFSTEGYATFFDEFHPN